MIPSGRGAPLPRHRFQFSASAGAELWDDQAERDGRHLVALLFVAGPMLERARVAEALRISAGRLERACTFLNLSPPHGLRLEEHADRLELVSAPDCTAVIERFLEKRAPEPLTQAALEVLAVVAYEQPVTRADISHIRDTDSSGVIDTLIARGLIADDPRYGSRGRPAFLVTTETFLRYMGVGSLAELPPLPAREPLAGMSAVAPE
jgi:segregation and condensation protein B